MRMKGRCSYIKKEECLRVKGDVKKTDAEISSEVEMDVNSQIVCGLFDIACTDNLMTEAQVKKEVQRLMSCLPEIYISRMATIPFVGSVREGLGTDQFLDPMLMPPKPSRWDKAKAAAQKVIIKGVLGLGLNTGIDRFFESCIQKNYEDGSRSESFKKFIDYFLNQELAEVLTVDMITRLVMGFSIE